MWTFSLIFIICMVTLSRLLLAENQDIKFFRLYAKMTGKGGAAGGSYFSELGRVLGCHMPNFRSLGKSLHIDNFCKNEGGGGPLLPFCPKKPKKDVT